MINLSHYQQLFDIENTSERCKRVNDSLEFMWKDEMNLLAGELLGQDYRIATYGQTLVTTYHDSMNPKYADQKKETNIGKKYFAQIVRKIGEKEIGLLVLEFNGIEKQLYIYSEFSFIFIHELILGGQLRTMLERLNPEISTFIRTGSFTRESLERTNLESYILERVKSQARPWCYFGMAHQLEGQLEKDYILDLLRKVWVQMEEFRTSLLRDRERSEQAAHIMKLLSSIETPYNLSIFGTTYQIDYDSLSGEKSGERSQKFTLKQEGQTVVQGKFLYREYEMKRARSRAMLAVDMEGKYNHIYTNVEDLLGDSDHEWWIPKAFRMKVENKNNEEVKREALDILRQNGFQVRQNEYFVGTYSNAKGGFTEDPSVIKGRLAMAALLFAHVSGRGSFRFSKTDASLLVETDDGAMNDDIKEDGDYTSSFDFSVIYETIKSSPLTFDMDLIRDLHLNLTAMDDKHFVILSGISGTGKTQLAKLYANAVYGLNHDEDNPYLSVIPVRPDWIDGTALFGYYSSFEKQYKTTEFLRVLLHAHQEREKPHFIILDEMNLARVEYYLSDYLSGVESRKDIPLHNQEDLTDIPSKINIPPNLYIIGTINVDETTQGISDKVLDRAFVMTLSDVNLDAYWTEIGKAIGSELEPEFKYLKRLHGILSSYHLHFGYRTMNEMLLKLSRHLSLDVDFQTKRELMLDSVIAEKVLPKLRGDDRFSDLLKELKDLFMKGLGVGSTSYGHIDRMEEELRRYGATQFWR